jgi:undecaprenyl-diphosphatase
MRHLFTLIFLLLSCSWATEVSGAPSEEPAMRIWQAAVLGAVEGFTEYLPVSSTGHLILTQRAMGIGQTEQDNQAADAYSICIQAGAILAVLTLYFPYMRRIGNGLRGRDSGGRRLAINLAVAFTPAAVLGLLLNQQIKQYLFGLWPIVTAWLVGGVAILVVAGWQQRRALADLGQDLEALTWRQALVIGLMQCIAMWPGTSRSLVTILGGLMVGMKLTSAVIFSFLLGVVTLTAATAYDAWKHGAIMLEVFGVPNLVVGFAVATVTAIISVKWLLAYLQRHGLQLFGYYRIALAMVVAGMMLSGLLTDRVGY